MIGRRAFGAALAGAAAWLAGCAAAPPAPSGSEGAKLRALLDASDEAALRRNPGDALFRGDWRFLGEFGDYLSDEYVRAERRAADDDLRALAAIDRARLAPAEQVACDAFAWQRRVDRRANEPGGAALRLPLRLDHFSGWHLFFAELSSGKGAAPYRSVADYEAGLSRLDGYVTWLDRAVARAREGAARGVGQPRLVVAHLVEQFDAFARQGAEASPYLGPIRLLPAGWPAAERERLVRAYAAALDGKLRPAFARTRDALRDEILPRARASVGLGAMPGGARLYRELVEEQTTLAADPAELHRTGLAEVERLRAEMTTVMRRAGFGGTLPQFIASVRADPRLKPASAEALLDGFRAIGERVDRALPRLFARRPASPLEIRPTPPESARTDAAARYVNGTPDGSRPGVFYVNTHNLPSRDTYRMETLYLHEAVPGHHFQIGLAQENAALPKPLRFGFNAGFVEGWALYAESLGAELGLFEDPMQRFGHLDDEMWRALRLVVDTGLHAFGWSREQAIETMLADSALSRDEATVEVERYIAIPAQALAYKTGELTIRRLRRQAEAALGARFDVREFHAQVLDSGVVPLAVLEATLGRWIASR